MRKVSRFQHGSASYSCGICKRRTRETGEGESGCQLCVQCFTLAGEDNHHNDNGSIPSITERRQYDALLAEIVAAGGDGERVRDQNGFIFFDNPDGSTPHEPSFPYAIIG